MYFLPEYDPRGWLKDALKCLALVFLFFALSLLLWVTTGKG